LTQTHTQPITQWAFTTSSLMLVWHHSLKENSRLTWRTTCWQRKTDVCGQTALTFQSWRYGSHRCTALLQQIPEAEDSREPAALMACVQLLLKCVLVDRITSVRH